MELNKIHVLLADDDLDDCNFFKMALTQISVTSQLTIVNDGEQLMKYLKEKSHDLPHVLFLDINMPRKNGLECIKEIREDNMLKDLPIVISSTTNASDTIHKIFKIGAHVYIHKPSDFAQLKQVIYHAIPLVSENKFSENPLKYILNAANTVKLM